MVIRRAAMIPGRYRMSRPQVRNLLPQERVRISPLTRGRPGLGPRVGVQVVEISIL